MSIKTEKYTELYKEIESLIDSKCGMVANSANLCAAIQSKFNFFWCGFYFVNAKNELELGPFQGPVACTRISKGKGVCGTSWLKNETIVVPDVHQFEGHIACSSFSNSEIVVPIHKEDQVIGVLDIDSEHYNHFDSEDQEHLEKIVALLQNI
jgi:L-methionine (R)-S-oxide reductase